MGRGGGGSAEGGCYMGGGGPGNSGEGGVVEQRGRTRLFAGGVGERFVSK